MPHSKRRRNKWSRARRHRSQSKHTKKRGGNHKKRPTITELPVKSWVKCESEGCAFYPSIQGANPDAVTKLYYTDRFYQAEKHAYDMMDSVDPSFQYHGKVLSFGVLSPEQWRERSDLVTSRTRLDGSYSYLEMEYAGVPVGSVDELGDNTSVFRAAFGRFLMGVLDLRTADGNYVIHGDPHPQNICYKRVKNGTEFKFSYIDLTNLREMEPTTPLTMGTDMSRQLYSLLGCVRIVFGFSSPLAEEWSRILMNSVGEKYENIVADIQTALKRSEMDGYRSENGEKYTTTSLQSPPHDRYSTAISAPIFFTPPPPPKKKRPDHSIFS